MLLVVDLGDLNLSVGAVDVELSDDTEMTVGQLIGKLCEGIEAYAHETLPDSSQLCIQNESGSRLDATGRIRDVRLDDWDTVYLKKWRR